MLCACVPFVPNRHNKLVSFAGPFLFEMHNHESIVTLCGSMRNSQLHSLRPHLASWCRLQLSPSQKGRYFKYLYFTNDNNCNGDDLQHRVRWQESKSWRLNLANSKSCPGRDKEANEAHLIG